MLLVALRKTTTHTMLSNIWLLCVVIIKSALGAIVPGANKKMLDVNKFKGLMKE